MFWKISTVSPKRYCFSTGLKFSEGHAFLIAFGRMFYVLEPMTTNEVSGYFLLKYKMNLEGADGFYWYWIIQVNKSPILDAFSVFVFFHLNLCDDRIYLFSIIIVFSCQLYLRGRTKEEEHTVRYTRANTAYSQLLQPSWGGREDNQRKSTASSLLEQKGQLFSKQVVSMLCVNYFYDLVLFIHLFLNLRSIIGCGSNFNAFNSKMMLEDFKFWLALFKNMWKINA